MSKSRGRPDLIFFMEGVFEEVISSYYVEAKNLILTEKVALPTIKADLIVYNLSDLILLVKKELDVNGFVYLNLDRYLLNEELLEIGSSLGVAIPENTNDVATKDFIEEDVILNISSTYGLQSIDNSRPFSINSLAMHTECSQRNLVDQPKYLMLVCYCSGEHSSAKTLFVSMDEIINRLSDKDIELLSNTRYQNVKSTYIINNSNDKLFFSFRDFGSRKLSWVYDGTNKNITNHEVNSAIKNLLSIIYNVDLIKSINWSERDFLIFDNSRFFHGKTSAKTLDQKGNRLLKRIRILN